MNRIIRTNESSTAALIARLALAITIFPHGAQKMLGWFGGPGFSGFTGFMTETMGFHVIIPVLVILIEFFGAIFLLFGLYTRIAALAVAGSFVGVIVTSISGFFMNWYAVQGQSEGLEYFVLLYGLIIVTLILGGGKSSIDAFLMKKKSLKTT